MKEALKTGTLLERLGFDEVRKSPADKYPSYAYDFGTMRITASQAINRHFVPIFQFLGYWVDRRTAGEVNFELPLELESFEQGVALIAYGLKGFVPPRPCPWLEQGQEWQDHLPWRRSLIAYEKRPKCRVDREWFRVALKKLRELADAAGAESLTSFAFDGEVLRVVADGITLAMPAVGAPWEGTYFVRTGALSSLPKRLLRETVSVEVWDGRLCLDRKCWHLEAAPGSSGIVSAGVPWTGKGPQSEN